MTQTTFDYAKVTESKSQPIKRLNGAPRLIEDDKAMTPIKINFSLDALKAKRAELARLQWKEYSTRGNTQRCQELWEQITKLDEEIAKRTSK